MTDHDNDTNGTVLALNAFILGSKVWDPLITFSTLLVTMKKYTKNFEIGNKKILFFKTWKWSCMVLMIKQNT